jgi:hypothetical protein
MFFKLTEFLGNKKARLISGFNQLVCKNVFSLALGLPNYKLPNKKRFFSTTKKPLGNQKITL